MSEFVTTSKMVYPSAESEALTRGEFHQSLWIKGKVLLSTVLERFCATIADNDMDLSGRNWPISALDGSVMTLLVFTKFTCIRKSTFVIQPTNIIWINQVAFEKSNCSAIERQRIPFFIKKKKKIRSKRAQIHLEKNKFVATLKVTRWKLFQ